MARQAQRPGSDQTEQDAAAQHVAVAEQDRDHGDHDEAEAPGDVDDGDQRPVRRATSAVTAISTTTASGRQAADDHRLTTCASQGGSVCPAPSVRTDRIWSTPMRPSRKASAPPTR